MNKETKVVKYLGQEFTVPMWANFIAADSSGEVYVSDSKAIWDERTQCWWAGGDTKVGDVAAILPYPCEAI